MVLLVPFTLNDRVMTRFWAAMACLLGLAHLATFRMGDAVVMLPQTMWFRYPHAGAIFDRIRNMPAFRAPDALLAVRRASTTSWRSCRGTRESR